MTSWKVERATPSFVHPPPREAPFLSRACSVLAPTARTYTNMTGRNVLAALAPDRPAGCSNTPAKPLARDRVIALDDALASHVDYTNCPTQRPPGAPMTGSWLAIPGSHLRIR